MTIKGVIFGAVLAIIVVIALNWKAKQEPIPATDKIDSLLNVGDSLYQYDSDSLRLNLLCNDSLTIEALKVVSDTVENGGESLTYDSLKTVEL